MVYWLDKAVIRNLLWLGGVQIKNLILCEGRKPGDDNEKHISETYDITPINDKNCYN